MKERELPDWIDSYLHFTQNTEPPQMYHLWSAITVLSATLKRKCRLDWGSLVFYPNLYVVLVGPPAARKGTAMNLARPFLEELQVRMAASATTREALILALKEATDTTVTVNGQMYFHSSLTIWSQELTVFLGYQNPQLMTDLTDWYDCRDQWIYRTKNMGTDDITGIYVTLFGATTPDLVRAALPVDAIGSGLTSRIIFINEQKKGKVVPYPGFSPEEKAIRAKLSKDLQKISMLCGSFTVTEQFMEKWLVWYPAQEEHPPFNDSKFAGYMERRANHIMKLSMIVNASRSDNMIISGEDLDRAITILERSEKNMLGTFDGVGKLRDADILSKIMNDIGVAKVTYMSNLLVKYRNDVDKWGLDKMLDSLVHQRFAVLVPTDDDVRILHRTSLERGDVDLKGSFNYCK
jgi:hypothetical protein